MDRLINLHSELHRIKSLRRNPVLDAYAFQMEALSTVRAAEGRIRKCRRRIETERQRLAARSGVRLSKEEARVAKTKIQRQHENISEARWVIRTTKTLVDGLAFLLLPKWDMKPLASKEAPGFISGKSGLRLERRILHSLAIKSKQVAILNDLTHCLRYGDITVPGNPPLLIEAKSGTGKTARDRRQEFNATVIADYLRRDILQDCGDSGWRMQRTELVVPERNHRRMLPPLVLRAYRHGAAVRRVESGLYYAAVRSADQSSVLRRVRSRLRDPFVVPVFRGFIPEYYFPLSLSLCDSASWWLIVTGSVGLLVAIDRQKVIELFAARDLRAAWSDADRQFIGPGWEISSPSPDSVRDFGVSEQFFGRVAGEFLSLQWFVDEVAARFQRGPVAVPESQDIPAPKPALQLRRRG